MKFIVTRDVLYHNLSAISGVMGSNSTMPILENFLFTIEGDKLKLTASDLDSTMTAVVELSEVEGEGSVAVPAKILLDTLKLIPETPIVFVFDEENNIFNYSAANGNYAAPIKNGKEFPMINAIENPNSFDISASVLHRAISKTLFATGNDEFRACMMGILCELSSEGISFVSTDAHKLVRYCNNSVSTNDMASLILPKKPMAHLKGILANVSGDVHVEYSQENHHISFSFDNFVLFSSLLEGKYPNYEVVIPKENPNSLIVSRDEFLKSIKRAGIYSNQSTFQVRISLSEAMTNIVAEDMDFSNKANENVAGEYVGENMEIGFNSKFLCEMLSNMDGDQVKLEMSAPNRAALILPVEEFSENETLLMLIMPVMLNY